MVTHEQRNEDKTCCRERVPKVLRKEKASINRRREINVLLRGSNIGVDSETQLQLWSSSSRTQPGTVPAWGTGLTVST